MMLESIIIVLFLFIICVLSKKNVKAKSKIKSLERSIRKFEEDSYRLKVDNEGKNKLLQAQKADFDKLKGQFSLEFENLAHKIFDEKTQRFKKQNDESLEQVLKPFKDKLKDFETKVDKSFGEQAKDSFSLKEQIEKIVLANKEITSQTESLTKALKGDSKTQGNWGEVMLEKILQDSGLRKDEDYVLQGTQMNLKDSETGRTLKPDVVVNLPDNKHIIIDAKVSLTAYERFYAVEDDSQRNDAIKSLYNSMQQHIKDLEKKSYQSIENLGTPDFILMFVPVEGAYSLVVQNYPNLHSLAWDKRIVIVCPSTLFATLRTVQNIWRIEKRSIHAKEIADAGAKLYDKVVNFVENMNKLGTQINRTSETYNVAMNQLYKGSGNVLTRLENMKKLGLKSRKELPSMGEEAKILPGYKGGSEI